MSKRKSTGKRLRFEVFKRDHFTCQYCGAQPPEIVLVCDHMVPVAKGGETVFENLVTACETCNQGKSDKLITERQPRPDADLMYLEQQQELAEMERYINAKKQVRDKYLESAHFLQEQFYANCFERKCPSEDLIVQVIQKYTIEIAEKSIVALAKSFELGRIKWGGNGWVKYFWAIAKNLNNESDDYEWRSVIKKQHQDIFEDLAENGNFNAFLTMKLEKDREFPDPHIPYLMMGLIVLGHAHLLYAWKQEFIEIVNQYSKEKNTRYDFDSNKFTDEMEIEANG